MPNWTDNQLDAINSTNGSVLVSASAGSGKTAVLVERAIKMLTEGESPVPADRLLVVTFTRAAAAEMKSKIHKRLTELIRENPDDAFLRSQRMKLQAAHISTVHSFCSDLIKENSFLLDINRDFRIGEEGELNVLKKNVSEKLVASMYSAGNNADFLSLVDHYSNDKDDKNIAHIVVELYEFLGSCAFPDNWLERTKSYYDDFENIFECEWGRVVAEYCTPYIDRAYENCDLCLDYMHNDKKLNPKVQKFEPEYQHILAMKIALQNKNWNELVKHCSEISFVRFSVGSAEDKQILTKIKQLHNVYKKSVEKVKDYFSKTEEEIREEIAFLRPVISVFYDLVRMFHTQLTAEKQEKNIYEYSDLEHLALRLLVKYEDGEVVRTELAKKISAEFDEIMVDEYQDTNEIQDTIFEALCKDAGNLFTVGDVKQSIYSFRQAMPEIFIKRKKSYPPYNRDADAYPASITLERNFRSRIEVTDSVNYIFRLLMSEKCGDLDYTEDEYLVCGANYSKPANKNKISLAFMNYDSNCGCERIDMEVDYVADQIFRIIKEASVTENGEERAATFSDFAILDRNANSNASNISKRLALYGINSTAETDDNFLSRREIMLVLNFLRVIDNPVQDIPLLSVMMSPIYSFTPDEVARLRINDRTENIYSLLVKSAQNGDKKSVKFLSDLKKYRHYSAVHPVHRLINKIYEENSLEALLSGMYPSTDVPLNNILLFKEYAKKYEDNGLKGLSAFVNYMDSVSEAGGKTDIAGSVSSKGNAEPAVKIMTIHKSKGLEFPFVFLINTGVSFHNEKREPYLFDRVLGMSLKTYDYENLKIKKPLPYEAMSLIAAGRQKSEEMRVLYVALTRAREELHIVCAKKGYKDKKIIESASSVTPKSIDPVGVADSSCFADWLMFTAIPHKDGEALREAGGLNGIHIFKDCPDWQISYFDGYKCESLPAESNTDEVILAEENSDKNIAEIIKTRFDFKYKGEQLKRIPVKVSVSDLSHNESKASFSKILSRPDFMSEKSMTATERGTAVHTVLQHINFTNALSDLNAELDRLRENGYITDAQRRVVDLRSINRLLSSDIVTDIINSEKVYREFRFTTNIRADEVVGDLPAELCSTNVILQGAVDLAYLKDGKLVIVDYKTDRVRFVSELAGLYSKQVLMYKQAMEECTPYKVAKCLIYSVRLADFVEVC